MSLAIDVDDVTEVLLSSGWYTVTDDSFFIDSYEFVWGDELAHGGGASGVCSSGFRFHARDEAGRIRILSGPLSSILAVSTEPSR